ncbi:MAG: hypothetical protein ACI9N1_002056 [Flavobacteriales bacterium]|jgi:hypothetical protein
MMTPSNNYLLEADMYYTRKKRTGRKFKEAELLCFLNSIQTYWKHINYPKNGIGFMKVDKTKSMLTQGLLNGTIMLLSQV